MLINVKITAILAIANAFKYSILLLPRERKVTFLKGTCSLKYDIGFFKKRPVSLGSVFMSLSYFDIEYR